MKRGKESEIREIRNNLWIGELGGKDSDAKRDSKMYGNGGDWKTNIFVCL